MVTFSSGARVGTLRQHVREIEDFPRKGVWTQDVTPLFQDPALFQMMIAEVADLVRKVEFDLVAGVESRGFMIGPPLASALGKGFLPIAKVHGNKLDTIQVAYDYEYSTDVLELPKGTIDPGTRVLVVDDQVVTGGTALAAASLIERLGGNVVGCAFILTQSYYDGLQAIRKYPVYALFEKNPSNQ